MKYLITSTMAALCFMTAAAQTAIQPAPTAKTQQEPTDEAREMSGQLKDAYGMVTREIAVVDREIGGDATKATPEQASRREKLVLAQQQLEGMLTTVNSGDRTQWTEIKVKAEAVRTNALSLIKSRPVSK